jgi:hypothetical protein
MIAGDRKRNASMTYVDIGEQSSKAPFSRTSTSSASRRQRGQELVPVLPQCGKDGLRMILILAIRMRAMVSSLAAQCLLFPHPPADRLTPSNRSLHAGDEVAAVEEAHQHLARVGRWRCQP